MTPQARCTKELQRQGYEVEVVERIQKRGVITWRNDFFGAFDLIAIKGKEVKAVQVTSRVNVSARCKKIADLERVDILREAGWTLEVWGWGRTKTKGDWLIVDVS